MRIFSQRGQLVYPGESWCHQPHMIKSPDDNEYCKKGVNIEVVSLFFLGGLYTIQTCNDLDPVLPAVKLISPFYTHFKRLASFIYTNQTEICFCFH